MINLQRRNKCYNTNFGRIAPRHTLYYNTK